MSFCLELFVFTFSLIFEWIFFYPDESASNGSDFSDRQQYRLRYLPCLLLISTQPYLLFHAHFCFIALKILTLNFHWSFEAFKSSTYEFELMENCSNFCHLFLRNVHWNFYEDGNNEQLYNFEAYDDESSQEYENEIHTSWESVFQCAQLVFR